MAQGVNNRVTELSTVPAEFFERYAYPDWLVQHSLLVGRIGELLARARRATGDECDPAAIALAGYLHDVGKSPLFRADTRHHGEIGALVLAAEALPGLAEAARRHSVDSVLNPLLAPRDLAERILYVADRRGGLVVQSVEERIAEQIQRHPAYAERIRLSLEGAKRLEREVFAGLPFGPDDLAAELERQG